MTTSQSFLADIVMRVYNDGINSPPEFMEEIAKECLESEGIRVVKCEHCSAYVVPGHVYATHNGRGWLCGYCTAASDEDEE